MMQLCYEPSQLLKALLIDIRRVHHIYSYVMHTCILHVHLDDVKYPSLLPNIKIPFFLTSMHHLCLRLLRYFF